MKIHYGNQNLKGLFIYANLRHLNFENLFQWPPSKVVSATLSLCFRGRCLQIKQFYVITARFELAFLDGMYDLHHLVVHRSRTSYLAAIV